MNTAQFHEYLKPSLLCNFDSAPEIKQTAIALTKNLLTAQNKVGSLYKFVKNLTFRYEDWDVKASDTLKRRWGMCSGKVNLFVAMLRSIKIPSRYVVLRCRAELELYEWMTKRNCELAGFFWALPREGNHVIAEVYLNGWKAYDVARDPALEQGFTELGMPFEIEPITDGGVARLTFSILDSWAVKRQESIHIKEKRPVILSLMNHELDGIRAY